MSCQTGIRANQNLLKIFSEAKSDDGNIRALKISIENDELTCTSTYALKGNWEEDYDDAVKPFIDTEIPCYILYRLDSKTNSGFQWLLINWVPDSSNVRQKMVHASTKATLKLEFGGSTHITEEIHATKYPEATFNGYKKAKKLEAAPAPLTNFEEEKKLINAAEVQEACVSALSQTLKGVCFPLTEEAKTAIEEMVKGQHNYLQFEIIIKDEQINLTKSETINTDQLRRQIPRDHPRYHVFLFKHVHEGITQEPYIFIYSMPDYARVSVKERMLYSSCKAPFVEFLTSNGIQIAKKRLVVEMK
ncbi:twinfilin-like isoform X2 [Condylostylus longicornis]|uniref:twinfilin-like isoform X2 n=1 Tax=Condylostylus longicornis TaxID=2530218 RepID=UPI00244E190D|nr:twinfilin-like isoform X2 [Condylostylus longicornis]